MKLIEPMIPHNPEAEQAVIAAILMDPAALYQVDLAPDEFFYERHQKMYALINEIARDGETPDLLTLSSRAGDKQDWLPYLSTLAGAIPSPALIGQYAEIVRRERIKRELLQVSTEIAEIAMNSDGVATVDLVPDAMGHLQKIVTPERGAVVPIAEAVNEYMPQLEKYIDEKKDVWGVPTGLDIDKYIGGCIGGDLTVIAGRPGTGKTSLAMQVAFHVALHGHGVMVFSLEMVRRQYMLRMFSTLAGVNSERIRRGQVERGSAEYHRIWDVSRDIAAAPLWIVDTPQTTASIYGHVAKMQQRGAEIELIVIDYNDMLQDKAENEITRTKQITRAEKQIARKFGVCVWALHALNRNGDLSLQSLMYGGDYDADEVVICDVKRERADDSADLLIEKNRNGDTCKVPMYFNGPTTQWRNIAKGTE
jgi:replicative DNA helicase